MKRIGVIDYGLGNLFSVVNCLNRLNIETITSSNPDELNSCDGFILPGVGAFQPAIKNLQKNGIDNFLKNDSENNRKPLFGICLGYQLLFTESLEFGTHKGLDLIEGTVENLVSKDKSIKVPHTQWNRLKVVSDNDLGPIQKVIEDDEYVYFVHSLAPITTGNYALTTTNYGDINFTSSILKDNIFATQFHPEKSGKVGLEIIQSWLTLNKLNI